MSTSHNLVLIYGFPADDIGLTIPTKPGQRAPYLGEWLTAMGHDSEVLMHHFGRVNGGDDPTPFIGVVLESYPDVLRDDLPGFFLLEAGRRTVSDEDLELLSNLRTRLQTPNRLGCYVMLGLT